MFIFLIPKQINNVYVFFFDFFDFFEVWEVRNLSFFDGFDFGVFIRVQGIS